MATKKSIPWGKLIKLFLEFVLAALAAIGTSKAADAFNLFSNGSSFI